MKTNTQPITVIHKGTIFGTATLMIFMYAEDRTRLYFHLIDTPKKQLKGKWVSNFKPIEIHGEILIPQINLSDVTEAIVADLVNKLIDKIEAQYSNITYQNYVEEITHGRH